MHGIVDLRYCKNWVAAEEQCLRYMGFDPLEKSLRYHALIPNKVIF
jgi:hypothetical protein